HAKREHSPVSEIPKARRKGGSGRDPLELAQIRRWARANGYELSDRGRISKEILNAYDAR
ncbi:histone-like nucleoid-structuring protein Lsr2, partial [Bacillus sp. SIMBA_008]|uniref:Lsr2 family DNA-binding protein n=1 Tax=Bacillus sp. SIMBA_008 TaxID=3085757 RepID=UPI00397DF101